MYCRDVSEQCGALRTHQDGAYHEDVGYYCVLVKGHTCAHEAIEDNGWPIIWATITGDPPCSAGASPSSSDSLSSSGT